MMKHFLQWCAALGLAILATGCAGGGLEKYPDLVQSDAAALPAGPVPPSEAAPETGVRITYFGTNSYALESRDATLYVDPFFTRMGPLPLVRFVPFLYAKSSDKRIAEGMAQLPKDPAAILITHSHYDHMMDVPEVSVLNSAQIITSPTGRFQALAEDVPDSRITALSPGKSTSVKGIVITALTADHGRVAGMVPWQGTRQEEKDVRWIQDWKLGEPLAYLIEMGGKRIFICSGGQNEVPPASLGKVDLAIIGVPSADSIALFTPTVKALDPKVVIPSHQDHFGKPLSKGFKFYAGSDMAEIRKQWEAMHRSGELVLLDYYRPWTLK